MNELKNNTTIFENVKHTEGGNEYWYARELQKALNYKEWRNFKIVVDKAIVSCKKSKFVVSDHFVEFNKMIEIAKGGKRKIRETIKELGGTIPEDLPTPEKSLKQLEKESKTKLLESI